LTGTTRAGPRCGRCWSTADPIPGIALGDYLIAATALTEGLELATLNLRHYPMFPGLARPF